MWYYIFFDLLKGEFKAIEFTKYITVRGGLAFFTSFMISVLFGPVLINMLRRCQFIEDVSKNRAQDLLEKSEEKKNTPTMGGIVIFFSFLMSLLIWARLDNSYVLWAILSIFGFGLVGFLDDLFKAMTLEDGITPRVKTVLMLIISVSLSFALWKTVRHDPKLLYLYFPFFENLKLDLSIGGGIFFILFATIVIVGSSNSVNLTDGLDGLAIGCTIIVSTAFSVIAYIVGRMDYAKYLSVPYIEGSGELSICCLALVGAGLGFLWFNCYPAHVFMGDCGSLMLGGFLGYIAVALRQELLLFILGGIFVMEALSVIIQVFVYKMTRKRVFRIAPIHHHFVIVWGNETKVTIRFWILGIVFALFAILTLRLR